MMKMFFKAIKSIVVLFCIAAAFHIALSFVFNLFGIDTPPEVVVMPTIVAFLALFSIMLKIKKI